MKNVKTKRGPGRPKGSKNKVKKLKTKTTNVIKRGRGRPKGSKNKTKVVEQQEVSIPYPNPQTEEERVANIAYMVSFYQHPDGRKKSFTTVPRKRGRKPALNLLDDDALIKGDNDSDHLIYTDKDIQDELNRSEGYQDFVANRSRYSNSF